MAGTAWSFVESRAAKHHITRQKMYTLENAHAPAQPHFTLQPTCGNGGVALLCCRARVGLNTRNRQPVLCFPPTSGFVMLQPDQRALAVQKQFLQNVSRLRTSDLWTVYVDILTLPYRPKLHSKQQWYLQNAQSICCYSFVGIFRVFAVSVRAHCPPMPPARPPAHRNEYPRPTADPPAASLE